MRSKCTRQFSQSEKHGHFQQVTTGKARSLVRVRWSMPCLAHLFSFYFTFHFLFTASPLPCPFQPTPLHAPIHQLKHFCWELYIQWMTGDHRRSSCSWNSQMVVIILHFYFAASLPVLSHFIHHQNTWSHPLQRKERRSFEEGVSNQS